MCHHLYHLHLKLREFYSHLFFTSFSFNWLNQAHILLGWREAVGENFSWAYWLEKNLKIWLNPLIAEDLCFPSWYMSLAILFRCLLCTEIAWKKLCSYGPISTISTQDVALPPIDSLFFLLAAPNRPNTTSDSFALAKELPVAGVLWSSINLAFNSAFIC